jgi:hypothetical protein
VIAVFRRLDIPYALGGSWASTVHGRPRFTQDADFTVEPFPGKEGQFAAAFGPDYYLSVPAMEDALRNRTSFNLINTRIGFKFDIFVRKDRPFDQAIMQRRLAITLPDQSNQPIMFVSAEDIILLKLEWYRMGGEASERQWQDVSEVVQVQGNRLDWPYLARWAADLNVQDLLARLRTETHRS